MSKTKANPKQCLPYKPYNRKTLANECLPYFYVAGHMGVRDTIEKIFRAINNLFAPINSLCYISLRNCLPRARTRKYQHYSMRCHTVKSWIHFTWSFYTFAVQCKAKLRA